MDGGTAVEFLDFSSQEACEEYEAFIQNHPLGGFTQSLMWCKVKSGWKHEVIIIRDDRQKIVASMLVLIKSVPIFKASMLYSPRGPVCDLGDKAVLSRLMDGVKLLAKRHHAYLFKCDPFILSSDNEGIKSMEHVGLVLQPDPDETSIQCRSNYILDIRNKTAEEIFEAFHKKWRYNIRLSERKDVVCEWFDKNTVGDRMDDFYNLMQQTGNRDGFYIRSKDYFLNLLNNLGPHCRLYLCYYQGRAISGAIAIQYAGKTCYVYGASSNTDRNVMPNHLMQWNMIKWAVENGDYIYDFQGIPHYDDENHPNYGVYQFKKGFNGEVVVFAGEFDYVLSPFMKKIIDCFYKINKKVQYRRSLLAGKLRR
jgi:peptidoglycan pentaglycine glycine transferase (the first glycine)